MRQSVFMTRTTNGKMHNTKTPIVEVAPFAPSVIDASALSGAWQIGGWRDFDEAITLALASLGFAAAAADDGIVRQSNGAEYYRIAPDKLWLRTDNAEALSPALAIIKADDRLTMTDISHSRMAISISGEGAESLMTRIIATDVASMQTNDFVQTSITGISTLIRRTNKHAFTIYAPATWHGSIHDYVLANAAME